MVYRIVFEWASKHQRSYGNLTYVARQRDSSIDRAGSVKVAQCGGVDQLLNILKPSGEMHLTYSEI